MKGKKGKGKRLKGIAMAASAFFVVSIVLIAFSSTASAESFDRTYTTDGGVLWYEGTLRHNERPNRAGTILHVYEGEKILFLTRTLNESIAVTVSGPCEWDGDLYNEYEEYAVLAGEVWDAEGKPTKGYFRVMDADGYGGWFKVRRHEIRVELVGKKEKVQEGEIFSLELKKNNRKQGVLKLTIEDDEGFSIMNVDGVDIYEILIAYDELDLVGFAVVEGINFKDGKLVFETSKLNMKEGKYKIILEDYATGADDDEDIKVEKIYLEVECDDEVVKGEDIIITIKSSFYEKIVNVTVDFYQRSLILDEEGKKKVKFCTKDAEFGTHKVTVEVCSSDLKLTKYVTVKKGEACLEEVPASATVGDIVHIEGASNFGDFAVFLVNSVFKGEVRISEKWREKIFAWYWDTGGELEGGREIEVFILNEHTPFSIGENISKNWQKKEGVDAAATIFLFPPMLRMTLPKRIADSDDVVISGKATGTDRVYIIVINESGKAMFPPDGTARTTPVEEDEWEENIGELDFGNYTVISLHKGKDGRTNAIENGRWAAGGENKTLEERVAIFMDAIRSARCDDLFALFNFTVEPSYVSFNPIENVTVGEPLEITGKTNREPGTKIGLWTFEGPTMLPPVITEVEWPTAEQGMFSATIDTSGAVPGIYTLKAEDGDGNTDRKTVEILVLPPLAPEA